jgi:pentalenic acid synthase
MMLRLRQNGHHMTTQAIPTFPTRRCPFAAPEEYAQWREHDKPVKVHYPDGSEVWAVTRYEDVKAVLMSEGTTANKLAPGFPQQRQGVIALSNSNLLYLDEPEHGLLRRKLSADFTARKIFGKREEIQKIVDGAIDDMLKLDGKADLHQAFSLAVPTLVICNLLGVPYEQHGFFQGVTSAMLDTATTAEQFKATLDSLSEFMHGIVKAKIDAPSEDDLLGRLIIEHVRTGELTYDNLVNLSLILLAAGHETTANQISMGTLSLLTDAELKATLLANPDLWPRAVDEFLRIHSIVDGVMIRMATTDMEVGGQHIKAGEGVLPLGAGANHDPDVFPEPLKVKLDCPRGVHHMSFGLGMHSCIGQNLPAPNSSWPTKPSWSASRRFAWPSPRSHWNSRTAVSSGAFTPSPSSGDLNGEELTPDV